MNGDWLALGAAAALAAASVARQRGSLARTCAVYPLGEEALEGEIEYPDDADPYTLMDAAERLFDQMEINFSRIEELKYACIEPDGTVIGALVAGHEATDQAEMEVTFSVVVDPKSRRQGIARSLVQALIDEKQADAADFTVLLHAWVVNSNMARLLETMGFEHTGSGEWSPEDPYYERWL